MKICNNKHTMTVIELIEKLKEYQEDLPVMATWEGQYIGIEEMSIQGTIYDDTGFKKPVLAIEADNGC
jgi:hypothetical protein